MNKRERRTLARVLGELYWFHCGAIGSPDEDGTNAGALMLEAVSIIGLTDDELVVGMPEWMHKYYGKEIKAARLRVDAAKRPA